MVHYEPFKFIIDTSDLVEIILDVVIRYHSLTDSIMSDWDLVFTSKFWSLQRYLLEIKQKLCIAFHPQTNSKTERQNSTIEAYFQAFVNYKQNDSARLIPMTEFTVNHAKNTSTNYTSFMLNCGFHPQASYKKDVNLYSKSKSVEKLVTEFK